MKKIKIAELKAHLSAHLRKAQRGEEIIVLDRQEPIAKISPFRRESSGLVVIPARQKGNWKKIKLKAPKIRVDSLKLLRQDRDEEYDRLS